MRLKAGLAVFTLGAVIAFWPAPRLDLSPIQRKPGTSIGTAWNSTPAPKPTARFSRPGRPLHPSSIYTPKTLR